MVEDVLGRAFLDLLAAQHHDHPVGDLGDHAHVVGDEHHRHADLVLQSLDQVEDLRLDRYVERGGWLVGDQQARPARQRHGDHHPLAHAAGELVRILRELLLRLRDADQLQHLQRLGQRLILGLPLVQHDRLGDLEADREHRVQRGHRLLEDHRDVVAADRAHLLRRLLDDVDDLAFRLAEQDLAARDATAGVVGQAHQPHRGHRLAGA